jgi:hypothetical protein
MWNFKNFPPFIWIFNDMRYLLCDLKWRYFGWHFGGWMKFDVADFASSSSQL